MQARGTDKATRFIAGLHRKAAAHPSRILWRGRINGLPGYVSIERDDVFQSTAFEIAGGRIAAIYIVRNPQKLAHLRQGLGFSDGTGGALLPL